MALKLCLDCGALSTGTRCPEHRRQTARVYDRGKRAARPERTPAERARRATTVRDWIRSHGHVCPGWRCDPHESHDLTADHVVPVAAGGDEAGELAVLCRVCNGRKQASI